MLAIPDPFSYAPSRRRQWRCLLGLHDPPRRPFSRISFSHLLQVRIEVADGPSPPCSSALGTIDPLQIIGDEFGRNWWVSRWSCADPHPAVRSHDLCRTARYVRRDSDAIADLERFTHYNLLNSRFRALRVELLGFIDYHRFILRYHWTTTLFVSSVTVGLASRPDSPTPESDRSGIKRPLPHQPIPHGPLPLRG
jgi:hypothetical protein